MKNYFIILILLITSKSFSQIISPNGNNLFYYDGAAAVTFKYAGNGSGGRAIVHDGENILTLNYGNDFTGGTKIGGPLTIFKGPNLLSYDGVAAVTFKYVGNGSGGRAIVHDEGNVLTLNYGNDFTGGIKIGGPLTIFKGSNLLSYDGAAAVTFKYAGNGLGGRAIVHDAGNVLTLNYDGDFNGGTRIGTTAIFKEPGNNYQLEICGILRAREIKVDLAGCDFVFSENYQLKSLNDIEKFIKENKHLPEIKKASEMETSGTNIGELSSKLLQKVEELTLYIIEQNKKIESVQKQNEIFKQEIELLKKNNNP